MILTGVAGLLAGGWLGNVAQPDQEREASRSAPAVSPSLRPPVTRNEPKRDFATLLKRFELTGGIPSAGFDSIERSSTGQLRALLVDLSKNEIDRRDWATHRNWFRSLEVIGRELWLRDGRASLDWAETTGSESAMRAILHEAARQELAVVKEWGSRYYSKFGSPSNSIIHAASCGAAMRSAGDLLAVEKLYGGDGSANLPGFAEDFDFRSYLAATTSMYGLYEAVRYWSALDPEAAAKGLSGRIGKDGGHWEGVYAKAFQGRAELVGDAEAARWIGGVMENVPASERSGIVRDFVSGNRMSESRIDALVEYLPADRDRVDFLSNLLRQSYDLNHESPSVRALSALKSEVLRTEVISTWLQNTPEQARGNLRDPLELVMESAALAPTRRDELRALIPIRN